ncbi:MAG: bifunctional adenosylcobinamide kinase/adenosylcobinamide-phosphate guanylyltransferase [Planctomycetes bacterium]|nr:bifunctional adenosylcobinamide kinase/adenosylcobinamide-phosphate guanylyltransferase [Planctomycetota bacterium]
MGKGMTLILGGARSGKSSYAQSLIEEDGQRALFVATATAGDEEMAARIEAHKASRPVNWITLEAPMHVGAAIQKMEPTPWVLLDCITLLTSNILLSLPEPVDEKEFQNAMQWEIDELITAYNALSGRWVIVSNEVGLGLVPSYPLGRYYRDALGRANQHLAKMADAVIFMVAGIPWRIK